MDGEVLKISITHEDGNKFIGWMHEHVKNSRRVDSDSHKTNFFKEQYNKFLLNEKQDSR